MTDRRFFAELAALVAAAAVCAAVANGVAARERKLAWVGDYPSARVVPAASGPFNSAPVTQPVAESAKAAASENEITTAAPGTVAPTPAATNPGPAATAATREAATTPAPVAPATPTIRAADFPPHPDRPSVEITSAQARGLHAAGVLFIDARRSQVYEQGHIPGSISMPVWESDIDDRVAAFYDTGHPQEAPIVIYCSGGACEDSHMLAQKLWGVGYNNALIYKDGWPDWLQQGGATAKGPSR